MAPAKKRQKLSNGSVVAQSGEGLEDAQNNQNDQNAIPEQQRRSLFVRSLPATATSQSLTELFSESYPIKHATAVIDSATKQCRGYGFVTFADAEDAKRAKEEFNGHVLEGRKLRLEVAEPRHRDAEKSNMAESGRGKHAKKQEDVPQPSRLIVRNLPWTIKTNDQLGKLFLSYGKIKQAYIPKKGQGLSTGFGFVVLRGRNNAEKALEGINGKEIDGRTLAVDWAVSKDVYEGQFKRGSEQTEVEQGQAEAGASEDEFDIDDEAVVQDEHMLSDDDVNGDGEGLDDEDVEDEDDEDVDIQLANGTDADEHRSEDRSTTLFVRNLPFTCTDEDLEDHFTRFGDTRYARVVMDAGTDRSKGTGFVCFYKAADADACLRGAPRQALSSSTEKSKDGKPAQASNSILQNEQADPSGQYSMDGRILQVSRAVDKSEAGRLTQEGVAHRHKRNEDKRRLYLLSEGTISSKSKLWESLSPSERTMREASAKQRKSLIESNPSLHLSLTRLSIRNIPRSVDSKELKALAREAVVGFASDVKGGSRQKLSKEELARGGEDMQAAERTRKKAGKGVVRQAKVVFEGAGGSKVSEESGAGRSRGYGFIEYYTHRSALMGLRWLNGHAIGYQVKEQKTSKTSKEEMRDRKKRLIVEFAIENAQVVMRRKDREQKARERSEAVKQGTVAADEPDDDLEGDLSASRKRKRGGEHPPQSNGRKQRTGFNKKPKSRAPAAGAEKPSGKPKKLIDEKTAKRNQIIGRKRAMRRNRKGAK